MKHKKHVKTGEDPYKCVRREIPRPGHAHRDENKYSRKKKHKKKEEETMKKQGLTEGKMLANIKNPPKTSRPVSPPPGQYPKKEK